jgi:hypothetical protein
MSNRTTEIKIPLISTGNLRCFDRSDFPSFTVYRGLMVFFDEDQDTRILTFIDDLSIKVRQKLFAVGEREGSITLVWNCRPPTRYEEGKSLDVCGDTWYVFQSVKCDEEEPIKHEVPLPFVPVGEAVCVVRGDTYMIRKWLSEVGFTFDAEAKAWAQTVQMDQYGRGLFVFKYSGKQVDWDLSDFIEACPNWDPARKLTVSFE